MKIVKTRKLTGRILSFVLTTALVVGLMPGNILTVSAEGTDTVISDELIVESVSSNDATSTTECTCETDDPAFHATNCPAYIAPENPQCTCVEKCTEDTLNIWCDVCGVQGVSACQGEDAAVAYEIVANGTCGAEGNESSVTWSLDSDGTLTISGSGAMWDYSTANIGSKKRAPWYEHKDNITTVIIEEGVTTIGTYAFWSCAQLTEITISATVTTIGDRAFMLCERLIQITIPQSVTSIGEGVFAGCSIITSVTLPNSISTIQEDTFMNCKSLTSLTIPEGVTTIGPGAFCNCTSLNSITIPEGVTTIGDMAFSGCTSLETIVIPSSVTTIGANVFDEVPGVSSEDGFLIINGILMKYTGDAANVEIPSGVTKINQRAFEHNQFIVTVKIPSGVTTLGNQAFSNCDSLVSVELPETLISMEASFIYCDGLKEITIPNGMETIGRYAFGECTSLEKVTIPNSVTEIGDYAFENIAADATIDAPCSWNENPLYSFADGITVNIPAHQNLTCSVNDEGNVINNECSNCGKVGGTLTINAEGGIYDGTTKYGATVEKTGTLENEEVTVNYYQGDTLIGTDAPVDVGTYTAKITYGDVTASCQFEITKVTPTADMFTYTSSAVYDGTAKSASVVARDGIIGVGEITNTKYYQNGTEVTPINAGTYTVKIDVAEGDNYDAATDIEVGTFEITKATPTYDMFTATPSSELVYDGTEKSIIVTTDKEGMGTFNVSYNPSQPVDAGFYIIRLHIEEGDNYNAVDSLSFDWFEIKKADSVITAAPTPIADLEYDGTALNLINAGTTTDGEMQYSLDGTNYSPTIPTGTDVGEYTVWYKVVGDKNHNDTEPASIEVTIAKGTPDIGTVSASNMENTLDVSQVVLSRSNETVPGTLSLAEGTTLQYGIHDYTYVFTPNDNTNYETVTGTVSITIKDTNAPTATYKVGTDEWKQFINTITFGHFCKDYTTVDITYSDEGSGVADKQYYISEEEITNTATIQWSDYTDTLYINATGKYYIYVRVTDNYGNVVIQNSEGIVVYAESVITPTSHPYEYGEENNLYVQITTNGNTFANLTDGSGNEIDTENYSIDGRTLTIKGEYLSDLDVGKYTYKICMNPQGVENTEVTLAYSFVVEVSAKELTVTGATATSRDYIANDKTVDITGITLSGIQGTDDVSVEITGLKGTLSSANAGTYTSVTLPALTLTGDDAENYVLVQPTSTVATDVTINKLNPTITVGETEYNKTFGEADFTLDITDDNPEANVTYSSNDENVVTVSNGTVTIKSAGLATITVSMGASTNYNAAVDKTVTVNVARSTYSVDRINKNYLFAISNADSINLAELLPEDCGTVNYASVTFDGALTFTSEDTKPKVTNGILAYTLERGAADDRGSIVVVVETQNYEDITIKVYVTLIDQIPVNVDGEVELNSNVLTYGETLSGLTFKSVDFVDNAGNEVEGTLAWKEPSATPNAGTTSATWVFTPNNDAYASVEGTVVITVNKATPNVTGVPTVADRVYNPSVVLADSDLTGGTVKGVDGNSLAGSWSWQTPGVVPVVNNSGYIAVFTPTDSRNYETVTRTITVNVAKATPYIKTAVAADAITYGATLKDSVLSGGVVQYSETDETAVAGSWSWKEVTTKPVVADSNVTQYDVVFTPTDAENYNEVETKITLTVNKAETTPNMPESTMSALYSQKTVGALELPEGWVWNEADSAKELAVDVAVEATAIYNGADKGNYVTESVTISITRQACDHEESDILYTGEGEKAPTCTVDGIGHTECTKCKEPMQTNVTVEASGHIGETEVKDAKKATCAADGYTGDTYCKDCGAKIATGTKIDKSTAHTWDEGVVTKEATATEKGEKTYTCSVCKTTKKEEIPALGAPEVGEEIASEEGSATYKVTEAGENGNSVTYEAPTDKNQATVVVPATVTINNITYNVTTISDTAFAGNKKLTAVTIGDNVTGFSANTFKGCRNLKTLIIGNGVTSIPANAFKNFKKLTTVKMGTGVKTIGKNAFYGCKKLKNLTLGKNVVTIGDKAFYKCTSLTKVTIPSKVKTIGKSAFYGCKKLKTLTIQSSKLTTKKIGSKAFTKTPKSMTVKVPKKKFKAYKSMFIKRGVNKKARFKKS